MAAGCSFDRLLLDESGQKEVWSCRRPRLRAPRAQGRRGGGVLRRAGRPVPAGLMVLGRTDAEDEANAAALFETAVSSTWPEDRRCTSGRSSRTPPYERNRLRLGRGAVLAGSAAGAMVLCDPGGPRGGAFPWDWACWRRRGDPSPRHLVGGEGQAHHLVRAGRPTVVRSTSRLRSFAGPTVRGRWRGSARSSSSSTATRPAWRLFRLRAGQDSEIVTTAW